jgi:hypothetical protein
MKNTLKNLNEEINQLSERISDLQALKTLLEEKPIDSFRDFQETIKQVKKEFGLGCFSDDDIVNALKEFSPLYFNKSNISRPYLGQEILIVKKFLNNSITAVYNLNTGELNIEIYCHCRFKHYGKDKFELEFPIDFDYNKHILNIKKKVKKIQFNPFVINRAKKIDEFQQYYLFLKQSKIRDEQRVKAKKIYGKQLRKAFRVKNIIEKYFILNHCTIRVTDDINSKIIYEEN